MRKPTATKGHANQDNGTENPQICMTEFEKRIRVRNAKQQNRPRGKRNGSYTTPEADRKDKSGEPTTFKRPNRNTLPQET